MVLVSARARTKINLYDPRCPKPLQATPQEAHTALDRKQQRPLQAAF
jgi:hypothetical protein